MDEDFESVNHEAKELSETKRVSRNINEKKRRDRFNVLIGELAAVIPGSSASGSSKLDKTTVLKKAVAYLRNHHSSTTVLVSRPTTHWQPAFVNDSELNQVLLEAMGGFVLVLDGSGIITYVSDSIISILGFRPQDVVSNSIADYLDRSDNSCIFARLALLENLRTRGQDSNLPYSSVAGSEPVNFEMIMNSGPSFESQIIASFSCTGQAFTTTSGPQTAKFQMVAVCYLNASRANVTQPLFDVANKEFTATMTLDWTFTRVDPTIMTIMGYHPPELINKSIYKFIHNDDLNNVKLYHEMLVRKGRINTCYYRFLTKGETWIWLRSCCYISYNQWNSKPEYVTATTSPVHYEEVYENQEVIVKNDRLHFQSISRDFRSESCIKLHTKRADSPLHFTPAQTKSSQEDPVSIFQMFANKDCNKPEKSKQDDGNSSDNNLPEGLSPAQYDLHLQLLGKHQLLEKSIQNQITELQKIKRQIEINKQLWEFNRQLQEKKAVRLGRASSNCESFSLNGSEPSSNTTTKMNTDEDICETVTPTSTNDNFNSLVAMEMPSSVYLTLQDLNESIEPTNFPNSSNSFSPQFSPLQPYDYFQY